MATEGWSGCKNLLYFNFSVFAPGLVSDEKIGLQGNLLNPQWNSISCLEGTMSLFSTVRLILNDIVETLASLGNKVERIMALPWGKDWRSSGAISRTTVKYVPFKGKPSSTVYWMESLYAA